MAGILIPFLIFTPWLTAMLVWFIGDKHEEGLHQFASAGAILSAILSLLLLSQIGDSTISFAKIGPLFGNLSFSTDALGIILACIANCIGSLTVIFSAEYMKHEKSLARYYSMVLLFIGAMSGLVLTANIFMIFFFWEITALCSYQLISFYNDDPNAVRGGLKALFITQFGGIGLMVAGLLIFGYTHSFEIGKFIQAAQGGEIPANILGIIGFTLIIAATAKSAQFPFFTWLPDAMEAPTPVSALIHAATMVNAGVYLLCRFFPALEAIPGWKMTILILGLITILVSSLMAIFATDLKRVLAYSTVSQLGYMFAAIGAGSVLACQFHLLSHAIFKALLFLCAGAIIHSCGTRDMYKMGGFFKKIPFISVTFIIGSLALAGIPVLNGFWSKELILESIHSGTPIIIYILMLFSVILTALYTIRCVWLVFFGEPRSDLHVHDAPFLMALPLGILSLGTITSWLVFEPFSRSLSNSLPLYGIPKETLSELVSKIFGDPYTFLALGMVAIGILVWLLRNKLPLHNSITLKIKFISLNSFGFEAINNGVVNGINAASEAIRNIQTGALNWNIFGMLIGLICILIALMIGGL